MRLVFIGFLLFLYSCKKENPYLNINSFIGKYLVCDSIKNIDNGKETVLAKGRGTGFDVKFDRIFTIFSVPQKEYRYIVKNSKIYFWASSTTPHEGGEFFTILSTSGNQLVLEYKILGTRKRMIYYYSVG